MRPPSPAARCALTAPFHPYLCPRRGHRRFAFCGTFRRRPKPTPGRYPAPCSAELGLSSIGTPGDPTATLTSRILVPLVYLYGWSRTTAFGPASQCPKHAGGPFAVGACHRLVSVLVEPVLATHPDVVRSPKPDAEGELECRTPKPTVRGAPIVPAEEPGRKATVGLQGTHGQPELDAHGDREKVRAFGRQRGIEYPIGVGLNLRVGTTYTRSAMIRKPSSFDGS